VINYLLDRLLK